MNSKAVEKISTKQCPVCGNENLLRYPSLNIKTCINHNKHLDIPWYLEDEQKPLIQYQR
jgi:hypothetical protein